MNKLKLAAADIDALSVFPFFNSDLISSLKSELSDYLAEAEGISEQVDILHWWKAHEMNLCIWAKTCKLVLLVQPPSAAAECIFSILSSKLSAVQESLM